MNLPKWSKKKKIVIIILALVVVIISISLLPFFFSWLISQLFLIEAYAPYPDADIPGAKADKLVIEIKQAGKPPRSTHTDITSIILKNIPLGSSKMVAKQVFLNNGFTVDENSLGKEVISLYAHRYPDGSEQGQGNGSFKCVYLVGLNFEKNKLKEVGAADIHCDGLQEF